MFLKVLIYAGHLFVIGALLMLAGQFRSGVDVAVVRRDWIKFGSYIFLIVGLLALAAIGRAAIACVLVILAIMGACEITANLRNSWSHSLIAPCSIMMVLMAFLVHLLPQPGSIWFSSFVFVLMTVATTDSFSQLWGKLLGRRRPFPKLSPEKTIAGLILGPLTAVAMAVPLGLLLGMQNADQVLVLGLVTAAAAVGGDLVFSHLKRRLGVKDFSSALPGHGGVLDRFDSLIAASPVYYWVSRLFMA